MNFHTGIIVETGESEVILDLQIIRSRYVRSWFAIDLISTLPIDYIVQVCAERCADGALSQTYDLAITSMISLFAS